MKAIAQKTDTKNDACKMLESTPPDEYGYMPGETLGARLTRLDSELAESRGSVGAQGEPAARSVVGVSQKPDWSALALGVLAPFEALLVSHLASVPYATARDTVDLQRDERGELVELARKVATKHSTFFAEHKDAIELGMAVTAIHAAQYDALLRTVDRPLSLSEVFGNSVLILAPLLIPLTIYLLNLLITKLKG